MGEILGMGLGVGMVAKKSKPKATVSLVYFKQKQEQRINKLKLNSPNKPTTFNYVHGYVGMF